MDKASNRWSHVEWVALMATLVGGFYLVHGAVQQQSARTDRLYEMFVEAQRDGNAKFYDLLKRDDRRDS